MLKTTYNEDYRLYGPGSLMRCEILRRVFDARRFRWIEFLGRLQSWQIKWCDEIRTISHVNYYRWPFLANIDEVRRLQSSRQYGRHGRRMSVPVRRTILAGAMLRRFSPLRARRARA